ncbi:MAG TPA: 2-C-methyl-D-erythritol 4-phosphate cytidylyltransferase [Planctomycetota bacterium]|nr:2-C-methyl-D-erythritol 4-phosphate cytidylyltransferase [Planctomycetota bacterium]
MDPRTQSVAVLLMAAGASTRFRRESAGSGAAKPFARLGGACVLEHAAAPFASLATVRELIVVARAEDLERVRGLVQSSSALARVRAIVEGGATRSDSVRAGLEAVSPECELVAVHDAARPLVTSEVVERALREAARSGAALVAVPVRDTIKTSSSGDAAEGTIDRSVLWAAQTPQVFRTALLRELFERAAGDDFRPSDEAALHERYIGPVPLVEGSSDNLKITTPTDLVVAEAILRSRARKGDT